MVRTLRFCAVALLLATAAHATTAVRLSDTQLVQHAEHIVVGQAVESRSAWMGRNLVTLVTVEVAETLKGAPARRLTVALPGGVDARGRFPLAMTFAGAPRIGRSERVVLFLTGPQEALGAAHTVVGFSQGKFSVVTDASGKRWVSRELGGLTLVPAPGARLAAPAAPAAPRQAEPLEAFTSHIRALVAAGQR